MRDKDAEKESEIERELRILSYQFKIQGSVQKARKFEKNLAGNRERGGDRNGHPSRELARPYIQL